MYVPPAVLASYDAEALLGPAYGGHLMWIHKTDLPGNGSAFC